MDKSFFSSPIIIPVRFPRAEVVKDEFKEWEEVCTFYFRRERVADSTAIAMSILGGMMPAQLRFARFCTLLEKVEGFNDFPTDKEIAAAAEEYFAGELFEPLIQSLMMKYDSASYTAFI
jgi:hypothetical protein